MRSGEGRRRHRISLVPTDEWMRSIEGFEDRRRTPDSQSCEAAKQDEGIESALCPQTSGCASSKGSKVEEEPSPTIMRSREGRRRHRIGLVPQTSGCASSKGSKVEEERLTLRSCEAAKEDEGIESA